MLWSYFNVQAQLDLVIRGPHVAALIGKAIAERFYKRASTKSYFLGCSNGGVQALSEAQRFPWDFDGIVSISGAPSYSDINMEILWGARTLRAPDGHLVLSRQDLELVHRAAIARCDMDDGVGDGIISDPYHCRFDPADLTCSAARPTACLTEAQVDAVRKIYAGPMTSKGEKKSYLRGAAPGSELEWIDGIAEYVSSSRPLGGGEDWALQVFRYMGFVPAPGPSWALPDFDFDQDYKRLGVSESLWSTSNPDLRKFKTAGGKLIVAQGWADASAVPAGPIDYYETTERTMGGRTATQGFFRLFVVPGMSHCTGGAGAFAIDWLGYLENWVEGGQAPEKVVGSHVSGLTWEQSMELRFPLDQALAVTFTRPIYPYPLWAKYKGSGDPNRADNFTPVGR
jgi:feruloyl esterase